MAWWAADGGMDGLTRITVTEAFVVLAVFCLMFLIIRTLRHQVPSGLKKPPGPAAFPFIGNVLHLKNPHLSLTAMSRRYGDVFQMQIGNRPVLVINGIHTIKQALVKQADDFAGRPDLPSFQKISDGDSLAFGRDLNGVWRARRKLAVSALRAFSADECKNSTHSCVLEEHSCAEARRLVEVLLERPGGFDPVRYIVISVANVICAICFGKRYNHDDRELLAVVSLANEFGKVAGAGNLSDFIPLLRFIPNPTMAQFISLNKRFMSFVKNIVNEHYQTFDKDNIRDITDTLIEHCQDRKMDENANIQLSDDKIVNIVNDLFGAGFDTITTGLSWAVLYLVLYPKLQKRLQDEIDEKIGRDRSPRLSDKSILPYTDAFILETFRHSSFLPFTIPHCTTKDTALNGYFIPKDTCVFVNQWQVNHDEKLWTDPFTFNPDRFLNEDGKGVNKTESEKLMLFGMGKRRCIGESIGRSEVFLFFTTLVQQLHFDKIPGQEIDPTPIYGLTMKYKTCQLRAVSRCASKSSE